MRFWQAKLINSAKKKVSEVQLKAMVVANGGNSRCKSIHEENLKIRSAQP
jgi:hypothetical protein